jgi:type I restriction enzyme S subunit
LTRQGAGRFKLTKAALLTIPCALPPAPEQEAITEALSDADTLIESLEQLLAKKRHLKQGAMQELLTGKRRLPGFATGQGYKRTEVGVIPEDWTIVHLRRLISSVEYGSSAKSKTSGHTPVLRMGNLQDGTIVWDDLVYTDNESEIRKYLLKTGDVLFNRTNTIDLVGKSSMYDGDRPAIFAGYLIRINVDRTLLDSRFLNYVLNTEIARKYSAKVLSVAVGQANINGQKLKTYPIPLPPTKAEQEAIATVLSDMDGEIAALEAKLAKARQIKQGMMQELLTGRIRLI